MTNRPITRTGRTLFTALALLIAACGHGTSTETEAAPAQMPPESAVAAAELWLDDHDDPTERVFHLEARHRSCRSSSPTVVRCVWARTSPVHQHFGWPQDIATQEFIVDGLRLVPAPPDIDRRALDDGLLAEYLDGWIDWLSTWHPELAPAVTRAGTIDANADVDGLQYAYWEYMAFTGAISLIGLPGTTSVID